jgi:hypothetical protein
MFIYREKSMKFYSSSLYFNIIIVFIIYDFFLLNLLYMLDSQDNMNRILECMLKKIFCADFIRVGFGVVKYIYEHWKCWILLSFESVLWKPTQNYTNKIKIRSVQSHLNDPNYTIFFIMLK